MTSTDAPSSPAADTAERPRIDRIIIRPWPKVVFLYPTLVVALVGWFASYLSKAGELGHPTMGWIFCTVFFLNLLVFAFDFSRMQSITIIFVIIAAFFGLLWAQSQFETFDWLKGLLANVNIKMNMQFYMFNALFLSLMLFLVFIDTRFHYYEINRNEILHHHGYLGDIHRTPTAAMRMQKEIYDLMEFALLRSGRLIFYPATAREALVIDNVIGINSVEDRIKHLLSSVSVHVRQEPPDQGPVG